MTQLYRVRVVVDVGSGALARVGRAFESLGGIISTLDLQDGSEFVGVCDATVELESSRADVTVISEALERADAGMLSMFEPIDHAVDPVLRAIRWACSIVGAGSLADDELIRVIREICSAHDAFFMSVDEAEVLDAAKLAAERSSPVLTTTSLVPHMLEASFTGAATILAVPDARLEPTGVAVVLKPADELFSATEIERVEAVLALRRRAALISTATGADTDEFDEGSWFDTSGI
jgi:hypothetical protein